MEGIYPAGTIKSFRGNSADIRVGNAGGVGLAVNGKDLGKMGSSGDVVETTYTLAGGVTMADSSFDVVSRDRRARTRQRAQPGPQRDRGPLRFQEFDDRRSRTRATTITILSRRRTQAQERRSTSSRAKRSSAEFDLKAFEYGKVRTGQRQQRCGRRLPFAAAFLRTRASRSSRRSRLRNSRSTRSTRTSRSGSRARAKDDLQKVQQLLACARLRAAAAVHRTTGRQRSDLETRNRIARLVRESWAARRISSTPK